MRYSPAEQVFLKALQQVVATTPGLLNDLSNLHAQNSAGYRDFDFQAELRRFSSWETRFQFGKIPEYIVAFREDFRNAALKRLLALAYRAFIDAGKAIINIMASFFDKR